MDMENIHEAQRYADHIGLLIQYISDRGLFDRTECLPVKLRRVIVIGEHGTFDDKWPCINHYFERHVEIGPKIKQGFLCGRIICQDGNNTFHGRNTPIWKCTSWDIQRSKRLNNSIG